MKKPEPTWISSDGAEHPRGTPMAREIAKTFGLPEAVLGLPTPWWRRIIQRFTRQP